MEQGRGVGRVIHGGLQIGTGHQESCFVLFEIPPHALTHQALMSTRFFKRSPCVDGDTGLTRDICTSVLPDWSPRCFLLCSHVVGRILKLARRTTFQTVAALGVVLLANTLAAIGGPLDELPAWQPPPDQQSLLGSLRPRLPANWRLSQPYVYLGISYVRVFIQDAWRGNPIAAAISLCPDSENGIWDTTRIIRLVMRYHRRDWPPYECRP